MSKRAEQERGEFEAWASGQEFGLTQDHFHKFDNGAYANYPTQCYWEVWQASRAAMKADPLTKAAPDLLEALEMMVAECSDDHWAPHVAAAREAIAKATGADHD